jgi:hypothetical protein
MELMWKFKVRITCGIEWLNMYFVDIIGCLMATVTYNIHDTAGYICSSVFFFMDF